MQRPKGGWKLKRDSHTVLVIWFKDGNAATFYSLDWKNKDSSFYDTHLGLSRLHALVSKYGRNANYALICLNDSLEAKNRTILEVYFEGQRHDLTNKIKKVFKN